MPENYLTSSFEKSGIRGKRQVESFNGRLGQKCLDEHCFMSLANAQHKIETWRRFYGKA